MEDLRGEKVTFDVKLHEIKEKVFPEFTDELAKEFGFESVEDFNTKQTEMLSKQKKLVQLMKNFMVKFLRSLIEQNKFDVPKTMVTQQENYLRGDLEKSLKQQGFNETMMKEYFEKWSADVTSKAEFQVKSGLILGSLVISIQLKHLMRTLIKKLKRWRHKLEWKQTKLKNTTLQMSK